MKYINKIIVKLKTIKYKKDSFYYLSSLITKSYFFFTFTFIFKFYLIDYTIELCYNFDIKYYLNCRFKICQKIE